mmetsp:Transcript_104887/g.262734  ORF Transcript_104887/g.262734 Transcript_104887/m.262734 type:complete len:204 (+) Transcript_104887:120-731(+)
MRRSLGGQRGRGGPAALGERGILWEFFGTGSRAGARPLVGPVRPETPLFVLCLGAYVHAALGHHADVATGAAAVPLPRRLLAQGLRGAGHENRCRHHDRRCLRQGRRANASPLFVWVLLRAWHRPRQLLGWPAHGAGGAEGDLPGGIGARGGHMGLLCLTASRDSFSKEEAGRAGEGRQTRQGPQRQRQWFRLLRPGVVHAHR